MKVPNGVTYDKIADGCDGMAGKLTDTERGMPLWMLMNPEIEELKRRTDALEKRAAALEKEIVLLVWAIAAAAAAVAAVLLVCMQGGEDMSEEIKVMIEDAVRKLETLPPMQQSLCVGFVLGAGATENTKKDEKEAG